MPVFVEPLQGIGLAGITFRNNTLIAYGEFRIADKVLLNK
jgi:hypothetical protein